MIMIRNGRSFVITALTDQPSFRTQRCRLVRRGHPFLKREQRLIITHDKKL